MGMTSFLCDFLLLSASKWIEMYMHIMLWHDTGKENAKEISDLWVNERKSLSQF